MTNDSVHTLADAMRSAWGPVTSELVSLCRRHMTRLLDANASEAWLAALHADAPASRELYRDPAHSFLLLAHTEHEGLARPPHDHGRGWVIYGVQRGEMEMTTYRRLHDQRGNAHLVKRESFVLRHGDVRVFLPGDVHDTRCTAGPLTLLRFTSRDFTQEELTRYPSPVAS
jgi:hypothetical protein